MPTVDYSFSNTAPTAVPTTSQAPSNTAPSGVVLASMAGTGGAPTGITLVAQTPNNAAPGSIAGAVQNPSNGAPTAVTLASTTPNNGAPAGITPSPTTPDNTPATPITPGFSALPLPSMPSSFTPAFVELTGAGPSLSTLTANAADAIANRIVQGTVGGQLKSYQVRTGTDATALPGIVRPSNYDGATNAVVFVQL